MGALWALLSDELRQFQVDQHLLDLGLDQVRDAVVGTLALDDQGDVDDCHVVHHLSEPGSEAPDHLTPPGARGLRRADFRARRRWF